MYCAACGSLFADDARFCATCGTPRVATQPTTAAVSASQASYPSQPYIGVAAAPQISAQSLPQPQPVYYADPRQRGSAQVQVGGPGTYAIGKNAVVAVLLSFLIPGVGQFYCGATKTGGIMLAIYIVSLALTGFGVGFAGMIAVWIWSMINAYNIASGKTPIS